MASRRATAGVAPGRMRAEKASGSRRDGRTELQVLVDFVQRGDTSVVTRIDRLTLPLLVEHGVETPDGLQKLAPGRLTASTINRQ